MSDEKVTINLEIGPNLMNIGRMLISMLFTKNAGTQPGALDNTVTQKMLKKFMDNEEVEIDIIRDRSKEQVTDELTTGFNGLLCALCGSPQFETPSGVTCANGHGGADGEALEKEDATTAADNQLTCVKCNAVLLEGGAPGVWNCPNGCDRIVRDTTGKTPPPPPPADTGGVELDKDGLPWDLRIHVSTQTKKKTGQWKRKPGVETTLVDSVEAELRAVMAIKTPGTDTPPDATAAGKAFGDAATGAGIENNIATSPPPPPATETTAAQGVITTYAELINAVTSAGLADDPRLAAALAKYNIPSMQVLGAKPDLVPFVAKKLFPGV